MRFKEFKEPTAPLGNPAAAPGAIPTKNKPLEKEVLRAGPPYPADETEAVKLMQKGLDDLGYSVGRTGTDGKYGPNTTSAVEAFKKDYKLQGDGKTFDADALDILKKVQAGSIPKVATPTPVARAASARKSTQLPPLSQDSVTQGKIGELLNFIARYESGGNYNVVFRMKPDPKLTTMTISEVLALQDQHVQSGSPSSAAGRYQYIRKTLRDTIAQMGLDPNTTLFDEKTQDAIATHTLTSLGLSSWLEGKLPDDQFLNKVARVWAGIPTTGGVSAYDKDGLNKAGTTTQNALAVLQNIKSGTATA